MRGVVVILVILSVLGCAKVNLETSKPLKVDINMRVDVYQHVVEDVESINDQIYGTPQKELNSLFFLSSAYASSEPLDLSAAIAGRKSRVSRLEGYLVRGYIGENRQALLQLRSSAPLSLRQEIEDLVTKENADRQIIYNYTANKNQTDTSSVTKVFFKDDYQRSPSGYWFEVYDTDSGRYSWKQK